jgi:protein-S-isoprenylcysteine O-methyltransferase Ste14
VNSSRSLPFRAAFAVLALPGMVAGVIPWWIHQGTERVPLFIGRWMGMGLGLAFGIPGFLIFASTVIEFFRRGHGTLAPWDPPRALVATGLYAWCRNPMYVGVLLMIWGQGAWWRSGEVVIYGYCIAVMFHLRVLLYEEPWLARTFPAEWEGYRTRVKRWGIL